MIVRRSKSYNLIASLVVVFSVILAFVVFQRNSNTSSVTPAPSPSPAATTKPTATSVPFVLIPNHVQKISIQRLNVVTEITQLYFGADGLWDLTFLNHLAGHLEGTPPIGTGGNTVLAGHVELKDGAPGPFAGLGSLQTGDAISILSDDPRIAPLQYKVQSVAFVAPDAIDVIQYHGYEELTLITCSDWDQNAQIYQKRIIVHALPIQ
jgi:LPXTG-site transpeptidase (sortase) family protein